MTVSATSLSSFRAGPENEELLRSLGALRELPGRWMGTGYNLISRPDKHDHRPFFLELNATMETLEFQGIGAPIPNRGSEQDDIFFRGVHYFQQISDAVTKGGLHLETGMWLNVPATSAPKAPPSIVRLATIPHGDALLAQGSASTVSGGPRIQRASSIPTKNGKPITDEDYLEPFHKTPPPRGVPAEAIIDPNVVLREAIKDQKIVETTTLHISTTEKVGDIAGGIKNIPFVVKNANAERMTATFWIEKVRDPHLGEFVQLQYTQTIILDFLGIDWPHINVATLVSQ